MPGSVFSVAFPESRHHRHCAALFDRRRASVVQAVDVAAKQGQTTVIFTTGGRTEKFAMRQLPELDESCFVQMGDFVKAAFTSAVKRESPKVYVGAMVGKLTKSCQGLSVT